MRRISFLAGIAALAALALPAASEAGLYERVRGAVDQELRTTAIESEVAAFVAGALGARKPEWSGITGEDIVSATKGDLAGLCRKFKGGSGIITSSIECVTFAQEVTTLARREQDLRAFGRRLQTIASRDELPVDGLRANATDFALHQQAILNVWLAGTGSVETGEAPTFRNIPLANDALDDTISDLAGALGGLPREELIAAVWRYRHGVRFVRSERLPEYRPPTVGTIEDTERQYLLDTWQDVEDPLLAIWNRLLAEASGMQLGDGAYGVLLPIRLAEDEGEAAPDDLLGNVLVWGRVDKETNGTHPLGDVGLLWEYPIEPVLPSLTGSKPILGGAFPPSAEDGQGLCSHPLAKLGYLCRPLESDDDGPCREEAPDGLAAITLTSCTDDAKDDFTLSGPEVCRDIDWHDEEEEVTHTCTLEVGCAGSCVNYPNDEWHTYKKEGDGTVQVCVRNGASMPPRYDFMRAVTLADAVCANDAETDFMADPSFGCCRIMGEAQQAACRLMEEDGVFREADGSVAVSSEGIPFTIEACTEVLTQQACPAETCPASRLYAEEEEGVYRFASELTARAQASPAGQESCEEARTNVDPRIAGAITAIERRDDIGRPGRTIAFNNSIGNLLCAAGSYLEEAMKRQNLSPGHTPYTVMDQIAPWSVQGLLDPLPAGLASGVLLPLTAPARGAGGLPVYRPALVAKTFDIALCGEAGLPPRVPPELCMLDAQRRLDLPLATFFMTAQGSVGETQDIRDSADTAGRGAMAIGTRMGNGYYAAYLQTALRSLTDVIDGTNDVLGRLRGITSPSLMCPGPDTPPLDGGSALSVGARSSASSLDQ